MNKIITNRQLLFGITMLSLSPIFRHVPKAACKYAGSAGYISIIVGAAFAFIPIFCVYFLIKKMPSLNIYDMLKLMTGVFISKLIVVLAIVWSVLNVINALWYHALVGRSTLIPYSTNSFIFAVVLLMAAYCVYKGIKTAMRASELLLTFFLILLVGLLFIAAENFDAVNLLPVSFEDTANIFKASPFTASVLGFIIFSLFYSDRLDKPVTSFAPYFFFAITLFCTAFAITVLTIGAEGAELASNSVFPFYSLIRRSSLLNIFERLEPFLLLPNLISDFILISFFMSVMLMSIKWIFNLKSFKYIFIPAFAVMYFLPQYVIKSQFQIEAFYYGILMIANFTFEFALPVFMVILYGIRYKKIKRFLEEA